MDWHGVNVPEFFFKPEFSEDEIDTICSKHKSGQLQNMHLLLRSRVAELLDVITHLKKEGKT